MNDVPSSLRALRFEFGLILSDQLFPKEGVKQVSCLKSRYSEGLRSHEDLL